MEIVLKFLNLFLDEFGGRVDILNFEILESTDFMGFIDNFWCNFGIDLILWFRIKI